MLRPRISHICILVLLWAEWLAAQSETVMEQSMPDSVAVVAPPPAASDSSLQPPSEVVVDIRSKAIAALAWPFEKVLQPFFGLLLYPVRPPVQYVSDNDLVDKGIRLITFGDEDQIFIYPTFNMKPGSGSSIGLAYRHRNLLLKPDYFMTGYTLFANGDWMTTGRYSKKQFLGTDFSLGGSVRYGEDRDKGFRIPDDISVVFADTSWDIRYFAGHPLSERWSWELSGGFDLRRLDLPDQQDSILSPDHSFGRYERGFYQDFNQYPVSFSLSYDSRDAAFAPTEGDKLNLAYKRVFVSDYFGPNSQASRLQGDHDYHAFEAKWQHYLLLGKTRYAMTTRESRESREQIRTLSFSKAMNLFKPEQIRQTLLERKVLVTQLRFRQMWEDEEGMAPFVAINGLGSGFPLRGYGEGAFTGYSVVGLSNEYRWPLDKLVDGVVFNEYGLYGRSWNNLSWDKLRNSWGFGFRVRKPDMFLTRFQLAFHGAQGLAMILTVSPAYD